MAEFDTNDRPANAESPQYGHPMRKHFLFEEGFVNLNHGSFGTYPSQVRSALRIAQDLTEGRPDPFIRYTLPEMLDRSRGLMADYVHVPLDELVFVPNATTGVNTILRNLRFEEGDTILYIETIYGACEKTVSYICETSHARSVSVPCEYSTSDTALVQRFRDCILQEKQRGRRVKVAIFEVIASLPGIRMPFERLVEVCREEEVLSLVDGAHGIGHVPLDLGRLDADFFVGNCHKWIFAPRGCAILHVPVRHQPLIRSSMPTSHGFIPLPTDGRAISNPLPPSGKSDFVTQFEFTGALDTSPYLCISECFRFINDVCGGEEQYTRYCRDLARQGGSLIAEMLGTEVMTDAGRSSWQDCFFSNVRLPLSPGNHLTASDRNKMAQWIMRTTADEYNTFIAVYSHASGLWVRLSAQVYLEKKDFVWAGQVLKELCQRARDGEHLGNRARRVQEGAPHPVPKL